MPTNNPTPNTPPDTFAEHLSAENEKLQTSLQDLSASSEKRITELEAEVENWKRIASASQQQAAALSSIITEGTAALVQIGIGFQRGYFTPQSIRSVTWRSSRIFVDGHLVAVQVEGAPHEEQVEQMLKTVVQQVNLAKAAAAEAAKKKKRAE